MTERKHFKQRVRARVRKTGESYVAAREQMVRQALPARDLDPDYLKQITGMSNEAVQAKTGHDWNQWIATLDAAGADKLPHREIAKRLRERHKLPGWWAQMVTVGYERVRGLRALHEKADGFSVNKSKTLPVPLSRLCAAWQDQSSRRAWLDEELEVRRSAPEKSMRILWSDQRSRVDVNFYSKGEAKSQVTLQHSKLANAPEAASLRAYWTERLKRLERFLLDQARTMNGEDRQMNAEPVTRRDIDELLAFLPALEIPGREFTETWRTRDVLGGGPIFPHPVYHEDVLAFFAAAGRSCWSDYQYRPESSREMLQDDQLVRSADLAQIKTMLTYCVRGERFCDGHWEALLKSGRIVALLRRLAELRETVQ